MLKITELHKAMNDAEVVADAALGTVKSSVAEQTLYNARVAYYAEFDAARSLKAQYEAMGDEDGAGVVNAGDTFDKEYGDDRFISTEYWNCAIGTVQVMRDCA